MKIIRSDGIFKLLVFRKPEVNKIDALFGKTKYPTLTFQLNILEDIDGIEIPVFGHRKARKRYPPDNSLSKPYYVRRRG